MMIEKKAYHFRPRRKLIRNLMRAGIGLSLNVLSDCQIEGKENIPADGPLLLVGNHFSFLDPVAVIYAVPWPIEFIGGAQLPNAPLLTRIFPRIWGTMKVYRGSVSRGALTSATEVLSQGGVLGIFPEGGSWARVLRPARPGAAYLAAKTGAQLLPVGLDGWVDFFPNLRLGKRPRPVIRFGKPFGPFKEDIRGRGDRKRLDEIGHEMMRQIAELLPAQQRGHYSNDPAIRAAAAGTEIYPWDHGAEPG